MNGLHIGVPLALAVLMTASIHRRCIAIWPSARRRTVLVACLDRSFAHSLANPFLYMKDTQLETTPQEPVGIVISRGAHTEPAPVFVAFVWGSAPDLSLSPKDTKAA